MAKHHQGPDQGHPGEEVNTSETSDAQQTDSSRAGETAVSDDIDSLRAALEEAQQKADDCWDQLLRARADLTNQQRRAERELENAHKFALDRFVRELLPIHDSLELGVHAATAVDADTASLAEGNALTLDLFRKALDKFGVKMIDPEGETFNPENHQAMSMQPVPGVPANTVIKVFQKGFLLNERLVRPATVIVSSGGASKDDGPKIDQMA
ncbi:MAG: nucleotide exchange factor GrpE [Gammaproteobacteria bacterium]|nr:nucleotide exchange factor GrpE [Gammaproteobacteria bacterium]